MAIALSAIAAAWLLVNALYFSAGLLLLLLAAIAVSLYHDRKKMIARMERIIAGIRHSDFSFHFVSEKQDEFYRMAKEMDEALEIFRRRSYDAMREEAETKAWQKLIRVLTHEIMNSIAPIVSLSETLGEREPSAAPSEEEYAQMIRGMETINRRSKGLLVFVENYRKLTRIPEPAMQPIHLKNLLGSMQQLVASQRIRFSYNVYPEQLLLMADRNMLEQILLNLLKNAAEARQGQSECQISIAAAKEGDEIRISVADDGQGIQPDVIDKIFIPFYSTKQGGSGIGLNLCRQMMLKHNGKITVRSDEKGSVFSLYFPC